MTCNEINERLSAFLDGRLPAPEREQVAAHLEACAACRDELAALRFSADLVASLPAPRLPDDLAPCVVARASTSPWRERWAALRDLPVPRRAFLVREFSRAVAIVVLFLAAATVRGRGPSDLVISWPGRVAGVAGAGMAYLTAELAEAQVYFSSGAALPARPAAQAPRERRPERLRPSSLPSRQAVAAIPHGVFGIGGEPLMLQGANGAFPEHDVAVPNTPPDEVQGAAQRSPRDCPAMQEPRQEVRSNGLA
jgi:anti-sigma factor RsiW